MFLSFPLSSALAYTETPKSFDRGDIAELFDFGSGIFAALLCGLSLVVYKKIKLKKSYLFRLPLDYLRYGPLYHI